MEKKLGKLLERLKRIVVGDMLFLVECKAKGKRCRREIHSVLATRNLVAEILAVLAHHGDAGEETGGAIFASPSSLIAIAALLSRGFKSHGSPLNRSRPSSFHL